MPARADPSVRYPHALANASLGRPGHGCGPGGRRPRAHPEPDKAREPPRETSREVYYRRFLVERLAQCQVVYETVKDRFPTVHLFRLARLRRYLGPQEGSCSGDRLLWLTCNKSGPA